MKPPVIKKVLIVYKKSSYQTHALEARDRNYLRLLREGNVATRRSRAIHERHVNTFETVKQDLKRLRIGFDVRLRYRLTPIKGYDLVITVGGDGTFLETSHHIGSELLLGVNSVPFESIGFFCKTTSGDFFRKMRALRDGRVPIRQLHRLQTVIDGKKIAPLALNDILFANQNPAGTTRYMIKIRGRVEEQKSSGLWISPAPGATAATLSAGGRILPLTSRGFQYIVREPYEPPTGEIPPYRLGRGILGEQDSVTLISMMDEAALYIDGPHLVYPIRRGSKIIIRNARRPIRAVW